MKCSATISMLFCILFIMTGQSPAETGEQTMQIVVDRQDRTITISLKNAGGKPAAIILNTYVQSPELVLLNPAGDTVRPFDPRSKMVIDATPYCYLVETMKPRSSKLLGTIDEASVSEKKAFEFMRFRFEGLVPGTYTAIARFESRIESCVEKRGGMKKRIRNVWLGTIESEPFEIHVR